MIELQGPLNRELYVACSGGVDSMAALDFLSRNHCVAVLHYDHGTEHGKQASEFVQDYCADNRIPFVVQKNRDCKPSGESWEQWWRTCRYQFFDSFVDREIVTCHHLDDCVENWIWTSMHGNPCIIPYRRFNVIRPFRATRKHEFARWAERKQVPHVEDPSNADDSYMRNYIRHNLMPHALHLNPGIYKTIKRKLKE